MDTYRMDTYRQLEIIPVIPSFGDPKWMPENTGGDPDESRRIDQTRKLKIIVIDDEPVIAETVVEILNHEGFEVTAASSGASAIELARTVHPDVVLSHVIMPALNGVETGTRIREIVPNCKIILFSGQAATVDLLEKARQQGHSFEILAKPISPEKLIEVIRAGAGQV